MNRDNQKSGNQLKGIKTAGVLRSVMVRITFLVEMGPYLPRRAHNTLRIWILAYIFQQNRSAVT